MWAERSAPAAGCEVQPWPRGAAARGSDRGRGRPGRRAPWRALLRSTVVVR